VNLLRPFNSAVTFRRGSKPSLSFRVGGKIIERSVDVGDHIQANQVLARLDPKDLKIQVETAQASVSAQQAQVVQTRAAFVRQQKLLPKGYTSQSEYDAANAAQLSAAKCPGGRSGAVGQRP
jgi:membrane fusion protein, multidrug efflux system